MPDKKSDSARMENRTIAMYPAMWEEILDMAENVEGAPAMARELIRRGMHQVKLEKAELRQKEALANLYEQIPLLASDLFGERSS